MLANSFLSIQETAKALGISRISAYRHVEAGTIPSVRVGSRRLVPASYLSTLENEAFATLSKASEAR
jgi:excisionase family DNA binding protein